MMDNHISNEKYEYIETMKQDVTDILLELLEHAKLIEGDILVVGCSSSEVANKMIGTFSSQEIGQAIFETLYKLLKERGIYLAAQCCEHLNRALIIEEKVAREMRIPVVNVIPQLKAGGSFATAAYHGFEHPVAVEEISAQAGIDIGDTLIGMHLKSVAVPVRTRKNKIGSAHVVCARTRPKFIGGVRASYDEKIS